MSCFSGSFPKSQNQSHTPPKKQSSNFSTAASFLKNKPFCFSSILEITYLYAFFLFSSKNAYWHGLMRPTSNCSFFHMFTICDFFWWLFHNTVNLLDECLALLLFLVALTMTPPLSCFTVMLPEIFSSKTVSMFYHWISKHFSRKSSIPVLHVVRVSASRKIFFLLFLYAVNVRVLSPSFEHCFFLLCQKNLFVILYFMLPHWY